MKELKKISEIVCYTMSIDSETNSYDNGFVLDETIIRKSKAEDNDPIYINVIREDGSVDVFVRSGANNIEPNIGLGTARIWRKV